MFQTSLMCISLTVNLCSLSYFAFGRFVEFLGRKYANFNKIVTTVIELHNRKPWLLGKIVTELSATCLIAVLAIVTLSTTSVSGLPFSGNQTFPVEPLIETVMSVNIGRYVYMIVQDCFLHDHLTRFKSEIIHHIVTTAAYVVFLAYKQNLFLSVAGLLMEVNLLPIEAGRLVRMVDKHSHLCSRISIVSCAVTLSTRGVIPTLFLAMALQVESPFTMEIVPLAVFFLCLVFFFVINIWVILQTISRVIKYSPCGPGEVDENMQNYVTVRNPTEPHSRNVTLPGDCGKSNVTFSSLNYGYMKCYDNRNVCNNGNDKMNFSSKKVSKPNLSFTAKGLNTVYSDVNANPGPAVNNNNNVSPRRVHFQDEVNSSRQITSGNDIPQSLVNQGSNRSADNQTNCYQNQPPDNQTVKRTQPTSYLYLGDMPETTVPTNSRPNIIEHTPITPTPLTEVV